MDPFLKIQKIPDIIPVPTPELDKETGLEVYPVLTTVPVQPKTATDALILAHVAADFIAHSAGLEGHQKHITGQYLGESLKELQESGDLLEIKELNELIPTIDSYCENCEILNGLINIEDKDKRLIALDNFIGEFTPKIQMLNPGERLFVPGGWNAALSGHAIMHVIEKSTDDDSYKFYTFNTGAGIDFYHLRQRDPEGMTHYKTVQCLQDIDQKNICNHAFLRSLFEMQVFPLGFEYVGSGRDTHFIYDSILPLLKGKEANPPKWAKEFNNEQRSGTCAWKCLTAYLKEKLSPEDYKMLAFLLKYNTLTKFLKSNPIEKEGNRDLALVANTAENLIRSLNKLKCPIPESKQIKLVAELKEIKTNALAQKSQNQPKLDVKSPLVFFDQPPVVLQFDVPTQPIVSGGSEHSAIELKAHQLASKPGLQREEITAENVGHQLDKWGECCDTLYKEGSFLTARNSINQFLMNLPLATGAPQQDPFWDFALKASDEEREQLILKIERLNDILYRCAFQLGTSGGEDLYSVMHSYAIQIQLMGNIIGYTSDSKGAAIGGGQNGIYEIDTRMVLGRHLKFNSLAHDDALRKNFKSIGKILADGGEGVSIRKFIEHYGHYSHVNAPSSSCKQEFLNKFIEDLERKGETLGNEVNLRNTGFQKALLSDFGQRNLLPPFLAAMNKQSFLLFLFESGHFFSKRDLSELNPNIPLFDIQFSTTEKLIAEADGNQWNVFIPDPKINGVGFLKRGVGPLAPRDNWLASQMDDPAFKRIVEAYDESDRDGNIIAKTSHLESTALQSIPYEERRELLLLSQTPSEMIVWQTLAYFAQYWDRLENKNAQALFDLLTTNQLKEEIDRNPSSLQTMLTFIEQGVQQFSPPEKLNGFLFCIDFGLKIHGRLTDLDTQQKEAFSHAFVQWENELLSRLTDPRYTSEQKQAVQVQLANLMLQHPYSKEQTAQVLLASACQEATPMPSYLQGGVLKRAFQDHLQKHRIEFLEELNKDPEFAARVMNSITMAIFGRQDPVWKQSSFPYFINEAGSMIVNIITGEARCQNSMNSPLPQHVLNFAEYKEVFGEQNFSAQVENFKLFTFSKDNLLYRVEVDDKDPLPKIKIEVQIDGKWCSYIPKDEVKKNPSIKPPLREGFTFWADTTQEPRRLLINNSSMETVYQCKVTRRSTTGLRVIKDLSPVSHPELVYNASIHPFLGQFEEEGYIINWSDRDGKLQKIEFPRYGLHFDMVRDDKKIDDLGKAYCEEFPGFYLKPYQELPSVPFLRQFLIIENDKGEKKVLIPMCQMEYDHASEALNPKGKPVKIMPPSYMAIDLNAKMKPTRLSGEQSVYLTYLALVDGDFVAVKRYLDQFAKGDSKGNLRLNLDLICNWCFENENDKIPAKDPITQALGLRAILMIYEKLRFSEPDTSKPLGYLHYTKVNNLFSEYLQNKNNATIYRLSDVEEKTLLQHLFAQGPLSTRNFARLARLQSGKPLEEEIFMPPGRNKVLEHVWRKEEWTEAKSSASKWISDCKYPWDGAASINKWLLTRPGENFVPYLLDCCLNLEEWRAGPKRIEVMDQLRIMRQSIFKGVNLMHDCLERILENPQFFQKQLDELKDVKEQSLQRPDQASSRVNINSWFDKVVKRYQENLIEFPPPKSVVAKQQLPLATPSVSKSASIIRLEETQPLPLLSNQQVENLFHAAPVPRHGKIPALKPVPNNDAANAQIETINHQLESFYAKREENPATLFSLDRNTIDPEKLLTVLIDEEKIASDHLSTLKKSILNAANAKPTGEREFYYEKQDAGGQKSAVTMDELIALFFKGDSQAITDKCPALSSSACKQLSEMIFTYLQDSTRVQQIRRSQKILNDIQVLEDYIRKDIKIDGVYYPSLEDAVLLISDYEDQLAKEMLAVPPYVLHQQPEYLVLEYYANIRLRPPQIKTLGLLLSGEDTGSKEAKELIVQLTMGSGKTKVLLPLLAMKIADGENLPIVVVPPALLEINKHDLAETSLKTFGQRPYVLDFHRNSSMEPEELRFMLQSLQNCIVDKRYVIATPSSLKCIEIKFKELAFAEKNQALDKGERQEQFELLGNILKLLKAHGTVLLDEADTILEARRSEVNFPIGKPKKVSPARIKVEKVLLKVLLTKPCDEMVHLGANKQRDMKDEDLKFVRESFVGKILDKYTTLEESMKLLPYFLGEEGAEVPNLSGHKNEKILKQAKEVATTLLPLVLKKNGNENYGRSHVSQKRYVVPYVANNTPDERSEFGQVDEVMLYSGFTYIQEGLKPYDVDFLLQEMLRKVRMEAKASRIPFQKTKTFEICVKRFGIKNIFNVSKEDRINAADSVRKDLKTLFYWMDNFVYPDIKIHNQKLRANSLDFVDMFHHVCGFTGTPWNRLAYHPRLQHPEIENEIDHPEDDIAILDAIWRNVEGDRGEGSSGIHVIDSQTPTGFLEAIMNIPDVVCLLDTGAIMKGIPNKKAAKSIQKLIDKGGPLKGTLFFDENNRIVVHFEGSKPVKLDTVAINERFSYYDQAHTTGADIKQSPRAKAVLTFSHNTVRDLTQGAMRMRRLLFSQAIELLVPGPTAKKIKAEGAPSFSDLLTAAIVHQSNRLADDIDYSTRQKLRHISGQKLSDLILSCDSVKDASKIAEKFEPILSDISTDEPSFKVMKPTLKTLEDMRQRQIVEVKALFDAAEDLPQHLKFKVEPLKDKIIQELEQFRLPDPTLLPEKRPEETGGAPQLESRVEIEKEVEVNEESQRDRVTQAHYHSWDYDNSPTYQPDYLSPSTTYEVAPKVITLKDVFESSKDLVKFEGIFDPLLRTTRNFVNTIEGQKELAFVPDAQKRCYQLILVKEKENIAGLMVDPIEAGWLRKRLPVETQKQMIETESQKYWNKSKYEGVEPYQHQVCILDLENGFQETIGPEFSLKEQRRMVELTAQAKFYNGYMAYSEAEWEYLQHWVSESGKAALMKELFEKSVNSQPGLYKFYEQSDIRKFLIEQSL